MKIKKKSHQKEDFPLQITSMADIFTILLVFLLKSFSADASKITPHDAILLPEALEANPIEDNLKVEISPKSLLLDDHLITDLSNFNFNTKEIEADGTSRLLNLALAKEKSKTTQNGSNKLLILADQKTPYSTLRVVLTSAQLSGFEDYKLVVVENQ